jgi:hypothetical protein
MITELHEIVIYIFDANVKKKITLTFATRMDVVLRNLVKDYVYVLDVAKGIIQPLCGIFIGVIILQNSL